MKEARYTNYADVIGKVYSKGFNEKVGSGKQLGQVTLEAGGDRVYINLWNPKKALEAGDNPVQDFFDEIEEGDLIQMKGELKESSYEDKVTRTVEPRVSAKYGVSYKKFKEDSTIKEKATLMLEGDVLKKPEFSIVNLDYFDNAPVACTYLRVAYFNLYNPETKKEDATKADVLKRELKGFYDYESSRENSYADLEKVKKWGESLKEDDSEKNVNKVLNEFYKYEKPRMWNIVVLNTVSYSPVDENGEAINDNIAFEIAENVEKYDNVSLGAVISNKMISDEYGFISGNVNDLEVKKYVKTNSKLNEQQEDSADPFSVEDEKEPW